MYTKENLHMIWAVFLKILQYLGGDETVMNKTMCNKMTNNQKRKCVKNKWYKY